MTARNTKTRVALKIISATLQLLFNIIIYVVIIMALFKFGTMAYNFTYQIFGEVSVSESPGKDITLQIKKGESSQTIAHKLELSNVIVDEYSFLVKLKLSKTVIMPGEYVLNNSMDYNEIIDIISSKQ